MASVFYIMAQEKYLAFCMVFFTFAQAAFKFIVLILPSQLIFYLQTRTVRHREIRWLV